MNIAKPTPGPWEWFADARGVELATPHGGHLIVMDFVRCGAQGALPRFAVWGEGERGRRGGVLRAATPTILTFHPDALLVAAAPDLLAACEAFLASVGRGVRAISQQGVESAAFASRADETAAAIRDMKAAVAKAKGDLP